ncbi:hypothetical protein P8452_00037 [Trifolium repens]|nr:hypothetical protein P8452_00037 [Trifolium repens]
MQLSSQSYDDFPSFHNLTHLVINNISGLVVQVLHHCPKLQNLELYQKTQSLCKMSNFSLSIKIGNVRDLRSQGEMRCSSSSSHDPENLHMELVMVMELVLDMKLVSEPFIELRSLNLNLLSIYYVNLSLRRGMLLVINLNTYL